jgi:hypothetical protein
MINNIQLCFTGAGGFYPYICGIAHYIKENYKLDNVILSGASSGCLSALFLAINCNIEKLFFKTNNAILNDLNKTNLTPFNVWNDYAKKHCYKELDENSYKFANDKLYISLTNVNNFFRPRNELINRWTSTADLTECIISSCFIPIYDNKLTYNYRNNKYIDGGITNNRPLPFGKNYKHIIIRYNMWRKLPKKYYIPSLNNDVVKNLFSLGYEDAKKNSDIFKDLTPK